jgi:hypothetical protein
MTLFQLNTEPTERILPSHEFILPTWYISPQKVAKFLLSIIASFIFFHFLEKIIVNWFNAVSDLRLTPHFFDFNAEGTILSLYSTCAIVFCGLLLAIIATIKKSLGSRYTKFWRALSFIFFYLAVDETCGFHELVSKIIRETFHTKNALLFPWVLPAFILLILFLISFRDFINHLPSKIRILFLTAGGIYISGAVGMEIIDGYIADVMGFDTKAYWLASSIEELLEMLGIVVFIYGLLIYLKSYVLELHCSFSFQKPNQ